MDPASLTLGQCGRELYAAMDVGGVSGSGAEWLSGRRLAGAALGLRGALGALSGDLFVAAPLARPAGFATASVTGGVSLLWSF